MGFTLVDGMYVPISAAVDGGLRSSALNLDFHVSDEGDMGLGIYDPIAAAWLQTPAESALAYAESALARAEQETARAQTAETRAEQETVARQQETTRAENAEAEAARLREELARLQARGN